MTLCNPFKSEENKRVYVGDSNETVQTIYSAAVFHIFHSVLKLCPSASASSGGLFKKQLGGYTEPFAGSRPCWAGQPAGVPFTTDL